MMPCRWCAIRVNISFTIVRSFVRGLLLIHLEQCAAAATALYHLYTYIYLGTYNVNSLLPGLLLGCCCCHHNSYIVEATNTACTWKTTYSKFYISLSTINIRIAPANNTILLSSYATQSNKTIATAHFDIHQ